jgi:hypothetical protein
MDEEPGEEAEEEDVDGKRGGEIFPEPGAAEEVSDAAEGVGEGGEKGAQVACPPSRLGKGAWENRLSREGDWAVRIRT